MHVLLMKNFTQSSGKTAYQQGVFQETTGSWLFNFDIRSIGLGKSTIILVNGTIYIKSSPHSAVHIVD